MVYDELIGESKDTKDADRFDEVARIEAMSPEEKFAFFQKELSKCIRCNACRNVCPACSCRKCVFDSNKFDSSQYVHRESRFTYLTVSLSRILMNYTESSRQELIQIQKHRSPTIHLMTRNQVL